MKAGRLLWRLVRSAPDLGQYEREGGICKDYVKAQLLDLGI